MIRNLGLTALRAAALAALLSVPAGAKEWSEAAHFDAPAKIEKISQKTGGDAPEREVTCTLYSDMMIRQRGTDEPDMDEAVLIRLKAGDKPDCKREPGADSRKLEATSGMNFLGRAGGFLVFEEADTNGVLPFSVYAAASGRKLIDDTTGYDGIDRFSAKDGALTLGFRRAIRVDCSVPEQGAACWQRLVQEETVPQPVASLEAPAKACAAAYRAGKAPKDSASIVSFDVELTWVEGAPLAVKARGPLRCQATP